LHSRQQLCIALLEACRNLRLAKLLLLLLLPKPSTMSINNTIFNRLLHASSTKVLLLLLLLLLRLLRLLRHLEVLSHLTHKAKVM
jgi:hypothetical protein